MKPTISINCPECGNDMWYTYHYEGVAKCTNCHFERPFKSRKRGKGITPSQQRAINKIHAWFLEYGRVEKLYHFEVKNSEGLVSVSVRTTDNPYTCYGAHIFLGRRGGIEVASSYDLYGDKKKNAQFYARMLGGKLWRHYE